jgi:hypothetical protein
MINARLIFVLVVTAFAAPNAAWAQSYPVSGKWTYENPQGEGPAKECGRRYMTFQGQQRFDTGGGVPSYRNVSVDNIGGGNYQIVDAFSTGQINARANYTLRLIDDDHLVIQIAGETVRLRRCQ